MANLNIFFSLNDFYLPLVSAFDIAQGASKLALGENRHLDQKEGNIYRNVQIYLF